MRVVAEGVETTADLDAVRALGCDVAQGYHLGRPMQFATLAELLARDAAPA
jgi:EAL domain-containing protein (putative c-di-GMP-specific phosphodiesterase class I)